MFQKSPVHEIGKPITSENHIQPQEEELGTTLLSRGSTYYLALYFMRSEARLRHLLAFDFADAAPGVSEAEVDAARHAWAEAFLHLCRKLTLRAVRKGVGGNNGAPRLLLKSPIHTARIPLIRSLFPNARFIYVHRNPYEVFSSSCHMADTAYWHMYLCAPPSDAQVTEYILWQYDAYWDKYEAARKDLPPGALTEIPFRMLAEDPLRALDKVYADLDLGALPVALYQPVVEQLSGYQPNTHQQLPAQLRGRVAARWRGSFERLGYPV